MNFLHMFDVREMMQFFVVFIKATMVILCLGLVENGAEVGEATQKYFFRTGFPWWPQFLFQLSVPLWR